MVGVEIDRRCSQSNGFEAASTFNSKMTEEFDEVSSRNLNLLCFDSVSSMV